MARICTYEIFGNDRRRMTKKFRAISLLLTYWAFGIATWDAVPTMYHEVATAYASCKKRCKVEHQLCIRKNNPGCSWLWTKSSGSAPVSAQCLAARSRKPDTARMVCRNVGTLRS